MTGLSGTNLVCTDEPAARLLKTICEAIEGLPPATGEILAI